MGVGRRGQKVLGGEEHLPGPLKLCVGVELPFGL
jgi:hypothetical protein